MKIAEKIRFTRDSLKLQACANHAIWLSYNLSRPCATRLDMTSCTSALPGGSGSTVSVVSGSAALKNAMKAEGLSEQEACDRFFVVDAGGLIGKVRIKH